MNLRPLPPCRVPNRTPAGGPDLETPGRHGKAIGHRRPVDDRSCQTGQPLTRIIFVLFDRFSGGLRPAVLFTVGMMGLPYRRFGSASSSVPRAGAPCGWRLVCLAEP